MHHHAHHLHHAIHHALSCGPVTDAHDLIVHALTLHVVLAAIGFVSRVARDWRMY